MGKRRYLNAKVDSELELVQRMLGLESQDGLDPRLRDVIFVCIDCEAFEHAQHKITEIGIAILDTRDIKNALEKSESWLAWMKYAHYRPIQYAHLENKRFVKGCADNFNFGHTTWINLKDVPRVLTRAFQDPARLDDASNFASDFADQKRNIVFVAHGARNDSAFLEHVDFHLADVGNIVHTLDTRVIAGGGKKKEVSLLRLLLSLELDPFNLHNGGNDAAYTLQALIIMAFKDFRNAGSVATGLERESGKLPPIKYLNQGAPQVWAGTAVRVSTMPEPASLRSTPAPSVKDLHITKLARDVAPREARRVRRERKQAFRLATNDATLGRHTLFPREEQKPLPSLSPYDGNGSGVSKQ